MQERIAAAKSTEVVSGSLTGERQPAALIVARLKTGETPPESPPGDPRRFIADKYAD